jgi:tRNA 2-thiouridine synthesizing protein A
MLLIIITSGACYRKPYEDIPEEAKALTKIVDVRGMRCPIPVLKARKHIGGVALGETLTLLATDPVAPLDLKHFCQEAGQEFVSETSEDGVFKLVVRRLK